MIIFVFAELKEILKKQRDYPWPRPDVCACCRASKVWGHGFVLAYFDGFATGIYIRRYRCPGCGCVIRLRPRGYFRRIQASIRTIRKSLYERIVKGRYLPGVSRSRQRHWLNGLVRNTTAHLGNTWTNRLMEAFERLLDMGKVPESSSV